MQLSVLLYIALGGAIGACSRYIISEIFVLMLGRTFPYGTLFVNIFGSFLMGLLISSLNNGTIESTPWKQILGLGFLGAFTTFSTFSIDNVTLFQQGEFFKAVLNILLNVTISIFAAWIGFQCISKS
ncbi:fluoride efflux transporter CrcB [Vibrio sp.]|uniref:fluoride efflux transporter CrcB n=1 Tax=Vibrio sp. TaxID=678 RepID=UPI003AA907C2